MQTIRWTSLQAAGKSRCPVCETSHKNRGDGPQSPTLPSSKRGTLWMAAFPSLGTLQTSVTSCRLGTQQEAGVPISVGGLVFSGKGPCACGSPGSILSLKLLQTGPTSQARVQLLCPALSPRGRCACNQPLQGQQEQGSQD